MQINSINSVIFSSKNIRTRKQKLYINENAAATNPSPTTPVPPPPGERKQDNIRIYSFEVVGPQDFDEIAINVNPMPKTNPPLPPGYNIDFLK